MDVSAVVEVERQAESPFPFTVVKSSMQVVPDTKTLDSGISPPVIWLMEDLAAQMQRDLEEIGRTHMPFGKYGPQNYPPAGVPIYDIPADYLGWFASKAGFPSGRLGTLLQMVYQMKVDGSDIAFDGFRKQRGGRTRLRPERK